VPQRQHHRGKHPEDAQLFSEKWVPVLREAVADLSFLLSRGYAEKSAQKLVGDHHQLDARQRRGVLGAACADTSLDRRREREVAADQLAGRALWIDGYNLLIGMESALSGAVLLRGRDGCIRDLASVHGSYHRVEETLPAIETIGRLLAALDVTEAVWCFDAPVSNSGRMKTFLEEAATRAGWPWRVELHRNPDQVLTASDGVAVTSDGWVLDRVQHWANLTRAFVESLNPRPEVIDLA